MAPPYTRGALSEECLRLNARRGRARQGGGLGTSAASAQPATCAMLRAKPLNARARINARWRPAAAHLDKARCEAGTEPASLIRPGTLHDLCTPPQVPHHARQRSMPWSLKKDGCGTGSVRKSDTEHCGHTSNLCSSRLILSGPCIATARCARALGPWVRQRARRDQCQL